MLSRLIIVITLLTSCAGAYAQKPPIDTSVYGKWPSVGGEIISNDGNYSAYAVTDPVFRQSVWRVRSLNNSYEKTITNKEIPFVEQLVFTPDSHLAVFKNADRLCILKLGTDSIEYIAGVSNFKINQAGQGTWLSYLLKSPSKQLVLREIANSHEQKFEKADSHEFSPDGSCLLFQSSDSDNNFTLTCVDLKTGKTINYWKGPAISNVTFSTDGRTFAFLAGKKENGKSIQSLWQYHLGEPEATLLLGEDKLILPDSMSFSGIFGYSADHSKLFLRFRKISSPKQPNPNMARLDVWSYTDPKLQALQLLELDKSKLQYALANRTYTYVLDVVNRQLTRLEGEKETITSAIINANAKNILLLKKGIENSNDEGYWNRLAKDEWWLLNTETGSRKLLKGIPIEMRITLSPDENFIVYYDPEKHDYFSYEIATGAHRNLTKSIQAIWITYNRDGERLLPYKNIGIAGWTKDQKAVLVYDQHDIWQLELSGKTRPLNLTNGYGKKHHIEFRLDFAPQWEKAANAVETGKPLLLSAFDRKTKDDGFFRIIPGNHGDPTRLTMQPYLFSGRDERTTYGNFITKARDAEAYLVTWQSAAESPNIFYSADLKHFTALTDNHPEKAYNWMTSNWSTGRHWTVFLHKAS